MDFDGPTRSGYPPPPPWVRLYGPGKQGPRPPQIPPGAGTDAPIPQLGMLHSTKLNLATATMDVPRVVAPDPATVRDGKAELRKLAREMLLSYVDLLDCAAARPSQLRGSDPMRLWYDPEVPRPPPVETVRAAVQNLLHVTNVLRPHQARLGLAERLRRGVAEKQAAFDALDAAEREAEEAASTAAAWAARAAGTQ